MLQSWTEIFEEKRTYLFPDGSTIVVNEPAALYVSSHGVHVLSNEDDSERVYIPKGFTGIVIKVFDREDWVIPPPRFENCAIDGNVRDVEERYRSGPWSVSELYNR